MSEWKFERTYCEQDILKKCLNFSPVKLCSHEAFKTSFLKDITYLYFVQELLALLERKLRKFRKDMVRNIEIKARMQCNNLSFIFLCRNLEKSRYFIFMKIWLVMIKIALYADGWDVMRKWNGGDQSDSLELLFEFREI